MKAYIAEAIGTFALTFVSIGAISNQPFGGDLLLVSLAYGLTVAVFVSATAAISGGQLNPAITLGVWLAGKIRGPEALRYWIAQLTGAVLAGFAAKYLFGDVAVLKGTPTLQVTWFQGFFLEAITTFFLVFVVFGTAVDSRAPRLGGLAIGLTVTLGVLAAFPLTGAAMNPARVFGPAIASGSLRSWAAIVEHFVYWLGPLAGGAAGGYLYGRYLIQPEDTRRSS
ncbi:MIP family channel proteins [Verrucomicrobium sp. GAS474]|uniref:MIP/aquaporin family protein n=1 Tax=Verrucomicrobium sp. GAS474 TaxID=1882831 RepID=UPI00087D3F01|nr:aquaporin [Verrucomicrobium sp. GAS474]SDT86542.1 MIP family channel proteins [Verrucomicrobium sp. GAS474]